MLNPAISIKIVISFFMCRLPIVFFASGFSRQREEYGWIFKTTRIQLLDFPYSEQKIFPLFKQGPMPANEQAQNPPRGSYNMLEATPMAAGWIRLVTSLSLTSQFRRGAPEDLWRHTLSQIPTLFGRLAYLASIRNQNTGQYEHHGFAQTYGADAADRAMRQSHESLFAEWLGKDLAGQKADLDEYFHSLGDEPNRLIEVWLRLAPYRGYVPTAVRAADRALFNADLEVLLETIRAGLGVSRPDPDAWQSP